MKSVISASKPFILLTAGIIVGAALVNSSSSQNTQKLNEGTEVGRYQYSHQFGVETVIFDTKTARLWKLDPAVQKWEREDAPWEWNQHRKSKPNDNLVPNDRRQSNPVQPRVFDPEKP